MTKKLFRSNDSKVIAGVCGGMGEYFDIDPVFIRIIAVLLLFADGIGLIAYIVAWIAMPVRPEEIPVAKVYNSDLRKYLPGALLIALGVVFLANKMIWWFHIEYVWPIGLIALGLYLVLRPNSKKEEDENESIET